jgi:hypothetical protein
MPKVVTVKSPLSPRRLDAPRPTSATAVLFTILGEWNPDRPLLWLTHEAHQESRVIAFF